MSEQSRMIVADSGRPVILFLCTANACRSQMAEALAKHAYGDRADVFSAGVKPGERVDAVALTVLSELGITHAAAYNKSITDAEKLFEGRRAAIVVTVCDKADAEPCPIYTKAQKKIHRGFRDPPHVAKERACEDALPTYREIRDEINEFIKGQLNQELLAIEKK